MSLDLEDEFWRGLIGYDASLLSDEGVTAQQVRDGGAPWSCRCRCAGRSAVLTSAFFRRRSGPASASAAVRTPPGASCVRQACSGEADGAAPRAGVGCEVEITRASGRHPVAPRLRL